MEKVVTILTGDTVTSEISPTTDTRLDCDMAMVAKFSQAWWLYPSANLVSKAWDQPSCQPILRNHRCLGQVQLHRAAWQRSADLEAAAEGCAERDATVRVLLGLSILMGIKWVFNGD